MDGWIKLHRKFSEWEWYGKSEMVHLFIHLLLNASHKDISWRGIELKRGELICGRKEISQATGISEQTIRTCLSKLKLTNEITIKSTNKFSIVTVCNYDDYQSRDFEINQQTNQQTNQQLTSNQPATNQQLTTYKNVKNIEKEINKEKEFEFKDWRKDFRVYRDYCSKGFSALISDKEWRLELTKRYPNKDIELGIKDAFEYWSKHEGWEMKKSKKNVKIINWKSTLSGSIGRNRIYLNNKPQQKLAL